MTDLDPAPAAGRPGAPADWWDELAVAALLGTDRRALTEMGFLPGTLQVAAARLKGDPAAVLLDTAALAVSYRRGGTVAGTVAGEPDRAPAELLPRAGRPAGTRLADLLQGSDLELLIYWCATAAVAGRLAPPECLPGLLDLAARQPLLREAVAPVLGRRGRWLAGLQPAWRNAVPADLAGPVDVVAPSKVLAPSDVVAPVKAAPPVDVAVATGGASAGERVPAVWQLGRPAQRTDWLRAVRRTDPAAGTEALAASWAQESGRSRAAFLPLLAAGLGPADEDLLERALDDGVAEVRAAAAELLSMLPSSRFAERMRLRAMTFVHTERSLLRSRLVVDVPDRLDRAAARDGLADRPAGGSGGSPEARRQGWLEQVVAATPLSAWEPLLGSARQAVGTRFDETWQQPIHVGWVSATIRQRNQDWAVALLETRSRFRVEELLGLLDGTRLDVAIRQRLTMTGPAEVQVLTRYLDACPVPWPPAIAADVLGWLAVHRPELHPRTVQPLLNLMSYRLPLEAGRGICAVADDLPLDDLWRTALRSVARLISVRTRIHEELQ